MYFLEKEAQASTNAVTSPTVQGPHGKYSAFYEFRHFKSCPVGCTAVIPRGQAIKCIDIVPQHTFRAYANFPDAQQSEITEPWRTQRNPDTS